MGALLSRDARSELAAGDAGQGLLKALGSRWFAKIMSEMPGLRSAGACGADVGQRGIWAICTMNVSGRAQSDVRMRGFAARTTVETALGVDRCAGARARSRGRCAGRPARTRARRRHPSSDGRAVVRPCGDGRLCAARRRNHGASEYNPLTFDVRGYALPGRPYLAGRRARQRGAHHDRRADACRRGCGGPCRVRARARRARGDRIAFRAGKARRCARKTSRKAPCFLAAADACALRTSVCSLRSASIACGRAPAARADRRHRR